MSTYPHTPKIETSQIVYEGYFDVKIDMLSLPHLGKPIAYTSVLVAEEAAVILAETAEGCLVINKEYRHPSGLWLYGLPGGRVDDGEAPLATAQRELREETGFETAEWHHLGTSFPLPAVCGQKIHFFLAKNVRQTSEPQKEPLELITTLIMEKKDLHDAIRSGAPTDGILLTGLSFLSLSQ